MALREGGRARVDDVIMDQLFQLANQTRVQDALAQMLSGEPINRTEHRAVLHPALRSFSGKPWKVAGKDVMPDVIAVRKKMKRFTDAIHQGTHRG